MKALFLTCCLLLSCQASAQDRLHVELLGQFDRGDTRYSGSWSYIDFSTQKEYALLGTRTGTAIYSIDNQPIVELGFIPGPASNWREITVIGHFAYVSTEGKGEGEGMQVIDLSPLPNPPVLVTTYTETFTTGHIIQRDIYTESPFVYVSGTCSSCGVHILNVSNPQNPIEVGYYNPGYYIHDCHVKGDYLYAAAFLKGTIDIVDISDKSKPTLVAQIDDPGGNTHSAWLTEDSRHLIISDEADGLPARIWNVEDLNNPFEVATYTANEQSLTHNPYVRGNYVFFSHNTEGLRVVDIKDPSLPVEVGYYDTFEGLSGGFNGLWSACPFFPSGKIIGGNREDGLYVWNFNNARAGRFYATVRDSLNEEKVPNVQFRILKNEIALQPDLNGVFKYGALPANYLIELSAAGYQTKLVTIALEAGDSLVLNILLQAKPVGLFNFNKKLPKVTIHPNPFSETTLIDLSLLKQNKELCLYDASGRLRKKIVTKGNRFYLLKREGLEQGVYILQIFDNEGLPIANDKIIIGSD